MLSRGIVIASLTVLLLAPLAVADEIDVGGVWTLTVERPSEPGGPGGQQPPDGQPPDGQQSNEDRPSPGEDGAQGERRGPGPQKITIVQEGDRLTVTGKGPRGTLKGKGGIKDGTISWTWNMTGPRGKMSMTFTGTVDGNKMSGTVDMGMGQGKWSAEKAKKKAS